MAVAVKKPEAVPASEAQTLKDSIRAEAIAPGADPVGFAPGADPVGFAPVGR